ncbi:MAG: hypothetical protein U5K54_22105 [Cytophagales bacterium]|nr:hypothetical protein [Cytophagales bacterium]
MRRDDTLETRLNAAVRKILEAKYNAGLVKLSTVNTDNLVSRINSPSAKLLKHQLAEGTVTLLSNTANSIPISILEGKKFASISSWQRGSATSLPNTSVNMPT